MLSELIEFAHTGGNLSQRPRSIAGEGARPDCVGHAADVADQLHPGVGLVLDAVKKPPGKDLEHPTTVQAAGEAGGDVVAGHEEPGVLMDRAGPQALLADLEHAVGYPIEDLRSRADDQGAVHERLPGDGMRIGETAPAARTGLSRGREKPGQHGGEEPARGERPGLWGQSRRRVGAGDEVRLDLQHGQLRRAPVPLGDDKPTGPVGEPIPLDCQPLDRGSRVWEQRGLVNDRDRAGIARLRVESPPIRYDRVKHQINIFFEPRVVSLGQRRCMRKARYHE